MEIAPSVLKHLGHEEKPVYGAVRVKRRQNLVSTSNPEQVSFSKLTFAQALHSQIVTRPPGCNNATLHLARD